MDQVNLMWTELDKNIYRIDMHLKVIESSYHSTPIKKQVHLTHYIRILTNIRCSLKMTDIITMQEEDLSKNETKEKPPINEESPPNATTSKEEGLTSIIKTAFDQQLRKGNTK